MDIGDTDASLAQETTKYEENTFDSNGAEDTGDSFDVGDDSVTETKDPDLPTVDTNGQDRQDEGNVPAAIDDATKESTEEKLSDNEAKVSENQDAETKVGAKVEEDSQHSSIEEKVADAVAAAREAVIAAGGSEEMAEAAAASTAIEARKFEEEAAKRAAEAAAKAAAAAAAKAAELVAKPPGPSGKYEGVNSYEGRKVWNKKSMRSGAIIAMSWRCCVARYRTYRKAQHVIEKIFDPRTNDHFYYNKVTTESRWTKAKCLGEHDIEDVAATYTDDQAAVMIQTALRRKFSKKKVRKLYAAIVSKVYDEYTDAFYYYNADTGTAFWDKPLLLGSQDLEDFMVDSGDEVSDEDGEEGGGEGDSDDGESEEEDSENDNDYASSGASDEGKAPRDYPRSKMQMLVDEAEDVEAGATKLDISNMNTDRISARIYEMVSLKHLDISHNNISRMSEDIGTLVDLQYLNVGHNNITQVPEELEEMAESLKTLILCNNHIKTYPANLYLCNRMETFDVSYNDIDEIPLKVGDLELLKVCKEWEVGMGQFTALTHLNIAHNNISVFPKQMERCPGLTELNLSHNKFAMGSIPKTIEANKLLKVIDISSNPIMTIPNEFTQFKYLERLYASGCGLKELPGNLRHWGNLHELVIDDNEMTGIDNSIVDLRTLTKLSMNRNKLKRISKQISKLTKLREIHLNDNELVTIPEALCQVTHLQHLYANNNRLKTQPTRLRKLVRLQHLDLRHNELETLDPAEFGSLISIRELDLRENRLAAIPSSMHKMGKCHTLLLSHNRLTEIPRELGNMASLRLLDLSHNNLTHLPESISGMIGLEELMIHVNQVSHLPEGVLQLGENLRRVRMERNAFEKPPDLLPNLPKLPCVALCQNKLTAFHEANAPRLALLKHQAKGLKYIEEDNKDVYDKVSECFALAEEEYTMQFQSPQGVVGDGRSDENVDYRNHFYLAAIDIHKLRHQKIAIDDMKKLKKEIVSQLENVNEMEMNEKNEQAITDKIESLSEELLQTDDDIEAQYQKSYDLCKKSINKFDVAESLCTQARMLGPGLDIMYNRAIAYSSSMRPHAAIADLDKLLKKHKSYEPAMILRGEARENLGQYSQAHRDVLKSSASKGLNENDKQLLERLRNEVKEGLKHITMADIDDSAKQRVFDLDANGIMRRRRLVLSLEGQSPKQDFILAHRKEKERKAAEKQKDKELMDLDIEVARNKCNKYKKIVEKSYASRMAFRKKEKEEIAKRKEEERKKKLEEDRLAQIEREKNENEDMAYVEWEQRDYEAKVAKQLAAEEAARAEEEAEAAELAATLQGRSVRK